MCNPSAEVITDYFREFVVRPFPKFGVQRIVLSIHTHLTAALWALKEKAATSLKIG